MSPHTSRAHTHLRTIWWEAWEVTTSPLVTQHFILPPEVGSEWEVRWEVSDENAKQPYLRR